MNKEFVMRGQTASGLTEVLNFSGNTPGYAYRLVEFSLFPSTNIHATNEELAGSVTAGKTAVAPTDPNFNNDGLIATTIFSTHSSNTLLGMETIVNDTFLITQDLILMVQNMTSGTPINWQCRFVAEKMNTNEEAVTNFKQYTISND